MLDEDPVEEVEPSPTLVRMSVIEADAARGAAAVVALCAAPVVVPVGQVVDDDQRC